MNVVLKHYEHSAYIFKNKLWVAARASEPNY